MVRPAEREDASRLAEIFIFSKRVTYRSIFKNDKVSFNEMQVLDLALSFRDKVHELDNIYVYDDGIIKGMIKWEKEKYNSDILEYMNYMLILFFLGKALAAL